MELTRPAWIEIDLDNLVHNIKSIRRLVREDTQRDTLIMAVLKGDAYGHGIPEVTRTLAENGISHFAVAMYSEAVMLKKSVPDSSVLILGYTPPYLYDKVIAASLTPTVFSLEDGRGLSQRARELGKTVRIHLKIDTGMHRLGFEVGPETIAAIKTLAQLPGLEMEGIYTHFATAHSADKKTAFRQFDAFIGLLEDLAGEGLRFPIRHISNSAAILDLPRLHLDLVRTGDLLYGIFPSSEVDRSRIDIRETLAVKSEIAQVKHLAPGQGVGYDLTYRAESPRQTATLSLGYTDLAVKKLENKGYVLVNGKKAPIIGVMSMDQMTVDVTDAKAAPGDTATLIGPDGNGFISVNEVAAQTGASPFLVFCSLNKRLPRKYIRHGKVVKIEDLNLRLAQNQ